MPKTGNKAAPNQSTPAKRSKKTRSSTAPATMEHVATEGPRRLKVTAPKGWQRLRPSRWVKHPGHLPSAWRIGQSASEILLKNWKLFLGITLVYTLLNILLVRGLSGTGDLTSLKTLLDGGISKLAAGLGGYVLLISTSGNNSSPTAGVYQTLLAIVTGLAVVWTLRQVLAGTNQLRIRDGFYSGMYPLIPVILVLLTIGLQLVPMVLGAGLYSMVIGNGIASSAIEHVLWAVLAITLTAVSFYLIISSIFALYIVTLPDMTPMKALRSARELVRHRRWIVLRKLLFLPFILLIISAVVMLPIILLLTPVAPWAFFVMTMVGLPLIHAYLYTLYRELLV